MTLLNLSSSLILYLSEAWNILTPSIILQSMHSSASLISCIRIMFGLQWTLKDCGYLPHHGRLMPHLLLTHCLLDLLNGIASFSFIIMLFRLAFVIKGMLAIFLIVLIISLVLLISASFFMFDLLNACKISHIDLSILCLISLNLLKDYVIRNLLEKLLR